MVKAPAAVSRAFLTLALLAAAAPAAHAQFGTNLIRNGGAEGGLPGTTVPGWTVSGGVAVVPYDYESGFPSPNSPGPVDRGRTLFTGGANTAFSTMSQTLSLSGISGLSALIAQGNVTFTLSAYLGGFSSQRDEAVFDATFFDDEGDEIRTITLGSVTREDRESVTGLLQRIATGVVPVGADAVQFRLRMTRRDGSYNDGYADNLSFVLATTSQNVVPEPSSIVLTVTGLGLLAAGARRRRVKD